MKLINHSNNYIQIGDTLWHRDLIPVIRIEKDEDTGKERLCITNGMIYNYIYGKKAIKEFLAENFRPDTVNEIKIK